MSALLFLVTGIANGSFQGINSDEAIYVLVILRYWIVANRALRKQDLLRLLLTVLLVVEE